MPEHIKRIGCLVEEPNDLSGDVLSSGLFVVHDTSTGGEDDVAKLTRWQQLHHPLFEVPELDVVAGGDDTGLVETAIELDDNLATAVVIHLLEFANVAVLLHNRQELDDDLRAGSDQDLTLAGLFGIVDALQSVVEDGGFDHFGGKEGLRFSSRVNEDLRCLSTRNVSLQ